MDIVRNSTKIKSSTGSLVNPSTSDIQTNGTQKTKLTDGTNDITLDYNEHEDKYELPINLSGHICEQNTSITPLDADEIFTGEWQDTINFGVVSIGIKTDQDSINNGLEIQWSGNSVDVDDFDDFTIVANVGKTFTFGPARRYVRLKYTNGNTQQTYFRLETSLRRVFVKTSSHKINDTIIAEDDAELTKSVLTGENPAGNFVNFRATTRGNFKTSIEEFKNDITSNSNTQLNVTQFLADGTEGTKVTNGRNNVDIDVLGSMKTMTPNLITGATFEGATVDTNFWTPTVTNNGTVTQDGELLLETNTTANGTAKVISQRKARKIPGTVNQFRAVGHLETDPQADNYRIIGIRDNGNGIFFKLDGTTLKIVSSAGGSEIEVDSGSFNGDVDSYVLDTDIHRFIIEYTAISAKFFIDDILIHTVSSTTEPYSKSLTLGIYLENVNTNGNVTDNKLHIQIACILRFGNLETEKKSYYQAGLTAGLILKYGAGELIGIVVSGVNQNSIVTLYDNTAASGTILWSSGTMGSQTQPFHINMDNAPFSVGLTLVISGAASNVKVGYE